MNFAFSVSSRKSERVAMRPALFQRKRRLQPSLRCRATAWSLSLYVPRNLAKLNLLSSAFGLNFQVPMRYEIILDVIGYRLLKAELGTVMSRSF